MRGRAIIPALVALLVLALAVPGAEAKKAKTFSETVTPNAAIPPDAATGPSTPLLSTITVPKKYKKRVVGDVNVTGIQTTGTAASAANDLLFELTSPKGRTIFLLFALGDQSIGPLTLDDDTFTMVCNEPPSGQCGSRVGATLFQPFAGTANLLNTYAGVVDNGPLSNFDGVKMRGTWTLSVADTSAAATNSTLNQWGLRIKPARPVED